MIERALYFIEMLFPEMQIDERAVNAVVAQKFFDGEKVDPSF